MFWYYGTERLLHFSDDYTVAKDWPLTQEQNELIDFGIRRSQAVLSGQAQPKGYYI